MDRMFLASRGTIDGFCLDRSITQGPPAFQLAIEANEPFNLRADAAHIQDATIVYISAYLLTIEYHTDEDADALDEEPATDAEGLLGDIQDFFLEEALSCPMIRA